MQDEDSPSFYNVEEAIKIVEWVSRNRVRVIVAKFYDCRYSACTRVPHSITDRGNVRG